MFVTASLGNTRQHQVNTCYGWCSKHTVQCKHGTRLICASVCVHLLELDLPHESLGDEISTHLMGNGTAVMSSFIASVEFTHSARPYFCSPTPLTPMCVKTK